MNGKKVNWLYLCITLIYFGVMILLSAAVIMGISIPIGIGANFILSEMMILLPGLLFMVVSRMNRESGSFNEMLDFHKIKISSFFMVLLFTILLMPMSTALNAISMLFVENEVNAISGAVLDMPFPVMLFLIGISGPFCEEFVFRGIVFRGYKNSGSVFWSIFWSALLFGLMHMNFNQAAYAIALGIMFALLVEATGSLWSSVIAHMFFNSQEVCLMYLMEYVLPAGYAKGAADTLTNEMLVAAIGPYLIVAVVSTALAGCVLVWLAKNQGREEKLRGIWTRRKEHREYLVSIPLIVAIVLSLAYMCFELVLERVL